MQVSVSLKHFTRLMGPYGLYQHSSIYQPLLSEGYCTDDNARAVRLLVRLLPLLSSQQQREAKRLLAACWQFVREAQTEPGVYVNFRDAAGSWQPQTSESEDMYARVVSCLVALIIHDKDTGRRQEAARMLDGLVERVERFLAPRAWAEALMALSALAYTGQTTPYVSDLQKKGYDFLAALWQKNSSPSWPWFEPVMTYANALFPHALLSLASYSNLPGREKILEESASFLISSTVRNNIFIPIGSARWYPKGDRPSTDNQQPIEAGLMFDFLLEYHRFFPSRVLPEVAAAPYLWFFGRNTGQAVMADANAGASYDGLFSHGINKHRGAESMLAYLWCEVLLAEADPNLRRLILRLSTPAPPSRPTPD
ncbi:MAG: hypothetical protein ABIH36_00490 [bacterium]